MTFSRPVSSGMKSRSHLEQRADASAQLARVPRWARSRARGSSAACSCRLRFAPIRPRAEPTRHLERDVAGAPRREPSMRHHAGGGGHWRVNLRTPCMTASRSVRYPSRRMSALYRFPMPTSRIARDVEPPSDDIREHPLHSSEVGQPTGKQREGSRDRHGEHGPVHRCPEEGPPEPVDGPTIGLRPYSVCHCDGSRLLGYAIGVANNHSWVSDGRR